MGKPALPTLAPVVGKRRANYTIDQRLEQLLRDYAAASHYSMSGCIETAIIEFLRVRGVSA